MTLLTAQGAQQVFQLQGPEGREHLRQLLQWEAPEEGTRESILLDTLYESLLFAGGKGFPWAQVSQVVRFTEELLSENRGQSLMEAVITLGKKLQEYQTQFNTTRLLVLCDYFQNTLLRHHQLYQFILGHDQDVRLSVEHVEVCVPPQPLALTQGTEEAVWAHEQQLAKLALAEAQKRVDLLVWKEVLRLEKEQRLRTVFSGQQSGNQQLCREELEALVAKAVHVHLESLMRMLQQQIQVLFDMLELRLQRKVLSVGASIPSLLVFPAPGALSLSVLVAEQGFLRKVC
ncbi:uncharacterized protein C8orf74 homolog [Suncus etruscus]|uniref:uncharacterized protein C8orf74 homolog n=1 Tax=Suncus etruscus TaxID=109475 RepID=UPI00210FDEA1|nr:uncharacterized protein C8orf74 homolog [Suncus etruscus]